MYDLRFAHDWIQGAIGALHAPSPRVQVSSGPGRKSGKSVHGNRMRLGDTTYERGLGVGESCPELTVSADTPITRVQATVGVDANGDSLAFASTPARLVFSVEADEAVLWSSPVLTVTDGPLEMSVELEGLDRFTLKVTAVDGRWAFGCADWADLRVTLSDGSVQQIGESLQEQRIPNDLPITFTYGGRKSSDLMQSWSRSLRSTRVSEDVTLHELTCRDPETGLQVQIGMKEFDDFPAVEWVARLRNTGVEDTPIIEDVRSIDVGWASVASEDVSWATRDAAFVHYSKGSNCRIDDFLYTVTPVSPGGSLSLGSDGGRSSSGVLPFLNIQTASEGVLAAIGWSGQWRATVSREDPDAVRLTAGMERTHLTLHPGEEIRTPSSLLIFWSGEPIDGNNILRRFIIAHHTPRIDGEPIIAPICNPTWGGMRTQGHLERIQVVKDRGLEYDYYWVDAGWYGLNSSYSPDEFTGDWAAHAGDWRTNPNAHPSGLKPISDAAHDAGMKFLLWMEPERAVCGTPLQAEHPDWFLGETGEGRSVLLNIGIPEARRFVTEMVSSFIEENGIDCFREDFNIDPLPFWRANDAEDRQGITEIRCIEGFYAFWDELLRRHPRLMIDNCASGGRRIDIETIGRSIPLWRSDYQCFPNFHPTGGQVQTHGLSHWVPLHTTGTAYREGDTYNFRSNMAAGVCFHLFGYEKTPITNDYPWEWHRKMTGEQRRLRPLFYGEYYPLTPPSSAPTDWMAYQLNRPDLGLSAVVALRREDSRFVSADFVLRGLDPEAMYTLEDADSGETRRMLGAELMTDGAAVSIDEPRGSRLIFITAAPDD